MTDAKDVQAPPSVPGAADDTVVRIAFLDDDHVLRLIRDLLSARTDGDWDGVAAFFAPEVPPPGLLRSLRAGLGGTEDVRIVASAAEASVFVLRRGTVDRALIESSPRLRLVQRIGERTDRIDLGAARERDVEVSCLPRPSLARTAEHAIMLMLALVKRLVPADRAVRSGAEAAADGGGVAYNWATIGGIGGLAGRTLGIVGLGEVGVLVAKRARAFGMHVLYVDRERQTTQEAATGAEYRSLRELLAESDVVSLHVPGAGADEPVIGRAEIEAMRPGALLVNTSRGWLIDEDALYDALIAGRLGGAGLDVHRVEPRPAGDRFSSLDNVVLTPHIAGGSRLDVLEEVGQVLDNIRETSAFGVPPHGRVAVNAR